MDFLHKADHSLPELRKLHSTSALHSGHFQQRNRHRRAQKYYTRATSNSRIANEKHRNITLGPLPTAESPTKSTEIKKRNKTKNPMSLNEPQKDTCMRYERRNRNTECHSFDLSWVPALWKTHTLCHSVHICDGCESLGSGDLGVGEF